MTAWTTAKATCWCSGRRAGGLPAEMLEQFAADMRIRIPMRPTNRSVNLSNAVAVVVYEAWRQQGFAGAA